MYTKTTSGFDVSKDFEKLWLRNRAKLERKLLPFVEDLPELTFFIKKHDKNHFFSGMMKLTLPKKVLISKASGHTAELVLASNFENIIREFDKYKGKHFKGSSKYRNHEGIDALYERG